MEKLTIQNSWRIKSSLNSSSIQNVVSMVLKSMPNPNHMSFPCKPHDFNRVLKKCNAKTLHAKMIMMGLSIQEKNEIESRLVVSYVKCRYLDDAEKLVKKMGTCSVFAKTALLGGYAQNGMMNKARHFFNNMEERNVVSWNSLIAGYNQHGNEKEALQLFTQMDIKPSHFTFSTILTSIANLVSLETGMQVHGQILKMGFGFNTTVANGIINMYAKCGRMRDAQIAFDDMPYRDAYSWTVLISGHAHSGNVEEAERLFDGMPGFKSVVSWNCMISGFVKGFVDKGLRFFKRMLREGGNTNVSTFVSALKGCASDGHLCFGLQLHSMMTKIGLVSDIFVGSALLDMYCKSDALIDAGQVFDEMPAKNVVSWSVMVSGYASNGRMRDAQEVFRKMPERNSVSWNAMIGGYARDGESDIALKYFVRMLEEEVLADEFSYSIVLSACAGPEFVKFGQQVHVRVVVIGFDSHVSVGNALVNMYAKQRNLDDACFIFNNMHTKDAVMWTTMITGYVENGMIEDARALFDAMPSTSLISWNVIIKGSLQHQRMEDALELFNMMPDRNLASWNIMLSVYSCEKSFEIFHQMHCNGIDPDQFTFAGVLTVCTDLGALEKGKQVHGYLVKKRYSSDVLVNNALITMYGKCGNIDNAYQVLNKMPSRNVVSWNAMISLYAQHGHGKEAIELFKGMQLYDLKPTHITFIGLLMACSHIGLVEEGWNYFYSMQNDYGISHQAAHYACMVDLLGRAGLVYEAVKLVRSMPFEPDNVIWGTLLSASLLNGNMEIGKWAAEKVIELEPGNASAYVTLSNLYAM